MPFSYILVLILLITVAILVIYYLWKTAQFRKQTYGKQTVGNILRGFARPRKYQVFSDVVLSSGNNSAGVDHILVGDFGVLFTSSIQGNGSFYGDYEEERWSFDDGKQKIYFKNPVDELNRKIELFRTILAQNKIYRVPVMAAVVIVGFSQETKLYITNADKETPVITSQALSAYLRSTRFETESSMDQEAVKNLLSQMSK